MQPDDQEEKYEQRKTTMGGRISEGVSRGISSAFNKLAMGTGWLFSRPYVWYGKSVAASWQGSEPIKEKIKNKALGTATIASVGGGLVAAYTAAVLGAVIYAGSLANVAWNDQSLFFPLPFADDVPLGWPATHGQWSGGDVSRFSQQGKGFCVSYEGFYKRGYDSDDEPFAVRRWNHDLIEVLKNPPPHDKSSTILKYADNALGQDAFGKVTKNPVTNNLEVEPTMTYGCHQHYDHTAIGVKYYKDGELVKEIPAPESVEKQSTSFNFGLW